MPPKRKASSAPDKAACKRSREDSFVPNLEDVDEYSDAKCTDATFLDAQSANQIITQVDNKGFDIAAYAGGDAKDDDVQQVVRHDSPHAAEDATIAAQQPFSASIKVNDTVIGTLTGSKIVLTAKTFTSYDGSTLPVARPTKRILRLGGSTDGEDGFNVPLPKRGSPCDLVEIMYSAQGCRVIIDGKMTWRRTWTTNAAKESLDAVVRKHEEEDKVAVEAYQPPINEWMQMYTEWRNWAIYKLADIKTMKQFPRIPTAIRRCKNPDCSLFLPNGEQRQLRFLTICKHDLEMWFRDAAGGVYNEHFYRICKDEQKRWQPAQFHLWEKATGATAKQVEFRRFANEIWRNCTELTHNYEQMMRGYVDIPEEYLE